MAAGDEKKPVTLDELKAGVRLTAGHRVVLIVQGAAGTTTTEAPETTTTAATTTETPSTTTTAPPEESTTAAPEETTTAAGTTTTSPSTTTTAGTQATVVVELPEEALDLLPDGALTLSGEGIEDQQIAFTAAEHADGVLRFTFKWDGISVKTKLVATAGSGSVTLWEDQPAGDPSQLISWSGAVSDLYPAPPGPGTDAASIVGSAIDDLEQLILEAIS
jgi:hypothetical protein